MVQQPELTPNMRVLLQRGEEKGYLSQEEILRLLSNMELGDGRVALFYDLVLERGIRVVDTLDTKEEKVETGAEGIAAFSSSISETMASVVNKSPAIDAAFCNAVRVTFAGSTTPALIKSV